MLSVISKQSLPIWLSFSFDTHLAKLFGLSLCFCFWCKKEYPWRVLVRYLLMVEWYMCEFYFSRALVYKNLTPWNVVGTIQKTRQPCIFLWQKEWRVVTTCAWISMEKLRGNALTDRYVFVVHLGPVKQRVMQMSSTMSWLFTMKRFCVVW